MPTPLSFDLRTRIVHACQSGELSQPEIADLFQVHLKTVEKYWHLARTGQPLAPKPPRGGPRPKLGGYEEQLRALVAERPDATLAQLSQVLAERHPVQASVSLLSRTLARLGLPQKKRCWWPANAAGPKSRRNANSSAPRWRPRMPRIWSF